MKSHKPGSILDYNFALRLFNVTADLESSMFFLERSKIIKCLFLSFQEYHIPSALV